MILWIAFASLFSSLLGYSRVPYSAALDGNFFSVFGRVHPKKRFPHVSLLFLGALTFVFALLFKLRTVIAAVLAMRLIIQFIGQAVGVVLLRRQRPAKKLPFKMWLYPLPVILTILGWIWLFLRTGKAVWWGLFVIILGLTIYLVRSKVRREWPFLAADAEAVR
jgi:amino acid transporter